jgi:replicative DNA helicase
MNGDLLDRLPPHNIDAEKSLISAILIDNSTWLEICTIVKPEDFYSNSHQNIIAAIKKLAEDSKPVDLVTVYAELKMAGKCESSGGAQYLSKIVDTVPLAVSAPEYARIVHQHAVERQIIKDCYDTIQSAMDPHKSLSATIGLATKSANDALDRSTQSQSIIKMGDSLEALMDHVQEIQNRPSGLVGISTGFPALDRMTSGFQPDALHIIAGRPSSGKSALALNMIRHQCEIDGLTALMFSLEMSKRQLQIRQMAAAGGINSRHIRDGYLNKDGWSAFMQACSSGKDWEFYIDDQGRRSPQEICSLTKKFKIKNSLDIVYIDHLHLNDLGGFPRNMNESLKLGLASSMYKALSKELNIPVIVLAQLNRGLESRSNKRPIMSDLRESGKIEEAADVIMFVYNPVMHDETPNFPGEVEIIIRKNRDGQTGTRILEFIPEHQAFKSTIGGNEND